MNTEISTKHSAFLLEEMENIAAQIRALIVTMPPRELLGYIYSQRLMMSMTEYDSNSSDIQNKKIDTYQFLLQYVHAVLASTLNTDEYSFEEIHFEKVIELCDKLKEKSILFAMLSSINTENGIFGPNTGEIEFHAKSNWLLIRGNRYQVLEGEFYRYVLAPHNDILIDIYGVSANDIAIGFQDMADATRSGQADAIEEMGQQFDAATTFANERKESVEDTLETWISTNDHAAEKMIHAIADLFHGGIANVSRHTKLPPDLLFDLAYRPGEETEFFAPGDYAGTPYRTLPARKKPLIQIGSDYYAIDPCFTRDAGYRALLHNVIKKRPLYKKIFEEKQKQMSEVAFPDILHKQLRSAKVYREVYYKDPSTKQWAENDTLIIIDDVLLLVEAKAGAAATIASPAVDFKRHAQSVQDLFLKAYTQCKRFFYYMKSAAEVPIYYLSNGRYEECGRINYSHYRVMVPIGLTIESFAPFSAYCKELSQVEPLLGKHAFISLSIDDLFVLRRFFETPGEFAHYIEVRQAVAGLRRAHLFDEIDHIGAYISKNRFDLEISRQLNNGKHGRVLWDGMGHVIDKSFEGGDWDKKAFPKQSFPREVAKLLEAIDTTSSPGWLLAESHIRDLSEDGRNNLSNMLLGYRISLNQHLNRHFSIGG